MPEAAPGQRTLLARFQTDQPRSDNPTIPRTTLSANASAALYVLYHRELVSDT